MTLLDEPTIAAAPGRRPSVAIVHDYLTQRGGAERVVLSLRRAFPESSLHTSLYEPSGTFPEFRDASIATTPIDRVGLLRRNHRAALPLLASTFSRLTVEADVVLCSSSGWAHGVRTEGRKIVYCHNPARWLYQTDEYVAARASAGRYALGALRRPLERWDRRAAASASRYLVNSTVVRDRVRTVYGIDAEVVPPPPAMTPSGESRSVAGLEPGFVLCVSRLLPYKNVAAVVEAFRGRPERLVVAGTGPLETQLRASAPSNVTILGAVDDDHLRWLYAHAAALVAASYEDFGLTPLEAATFGKPVAVLRWGGFLDTVVEDLTGVFFDAPEPAAIADAIGRLGRRQWTTAAIAAHAECFSEQRFIERLRAVVAEEIAPTPRGFERLAS